MHGPKTAAIIMIGIKELLMIYINILLSNSVIKIPTQKPITNLATI